MLKGEAIKVDGLRYEEICILMASPDGGEFHLEKREDGLYAVKD